MAGALDYLFQGQLPEATTTATGSNGLPAWYNQYVQGVAGKAVNAAQNAENTPVPQQGVAGFNPDQLAAFEAIRKNQGAWRDAAAGAQTGIVNSYYNGQNVQQQAAQAGQNALGLMTNIGEGAVKHLLPAGQNALTGLAGAGQGALTGMSNSANTAAGLANSLAGSAVSNANAAAGAAAGNANAAVAGPSRNWIDEGTMQKYMSPYTSAVVDEIGRLGNQNWMQNIMPSVQSSMIGSGQFGSTRNATVLGNAANQNQQNTLGQQRQALESGYTTAGNLFNQDANRHQQQQELQANTALQGGQLTSNTALQGGQLGANTALTGGQLQQSALQAGHNANINALTSGHQLNLGAINNAANTALNAAQQGSALNMQGILQGGQLGVNSSLNAAQQAAQLAQLYQQLGITDAGALQSIGNQQQQLDQTALNTAYNNALATNNYDWNTLNNLSSLLRGQQLPTSTTQTQSTIQSGGTQAPATNLFSGLAGIMGS